MNQVRLALNGFGSVNQELCRILQRKQAGLNKHLQAPISIVGVSDSKGAVFNSGGFDIPTLLSIKSQCKPITDVANEASYTSADTKTFSNAVRMLESSGNNFDILVDGAPGARLDPSDPSSASITLDSVCPTWNYALANGKHVVTANKTPLVVAWDQIQDLITSSREKNLNSESTLLYSATVCGGLPVVNVLKRDILPFIASFNRIDGIYNSTTNFILTQMTDSLLTSGSGAKSDAFEAALKEAQARGIAETDPTLDVDGFDTAYKLFIILKTVGVENIVFNDIKVGGLRKDDMIEGSSLMEQIVDADANGMKVKLVASAVKNEAGGWDLRSGLRKVEKGSFLGSCDRTNMGIIADTDLFEKFSFQTNEFGVVSTSSAVLRDIVSVAQDMERQYRENVL